MNILFDTNILLDVFLKRNPFYKASIKLVSHVEWAEIDGWLGGTTVTTIHYLLAKYLNRRQANRHIKTLFELFHIASVNQVVLSGAINDQFTDYEDAVLHQAAIHANLDGIVTRNTSDFSKAQLPIYTPEELLNMM